MTHPLLGQTAVLISTYQLLFQLQALLPLIWSFWCNSNKVTLIRHFKVGMRKQRIPAHFYFDIDLMKIKRYHSKERKRSITPPGKLFGGKSGNKVQIKQESHLNLARKQFFLLDQSFSIPKIASLLFLLTYFKKSSCSKSGPPERLVPTIFCQI